MRLLNEGRPVSVPVAPNPATPTLPTSAPTLPGRAPVPTARPAAPTVGQSGVAANPALTMAPTPTVTAPQASQSLPIAAAMQSYQESGNPFTAFAQGWVNTQAAGEQQAAEAGKIAEERRIAQANAAREESRWQQEFALDKANTQSQISERTSAAELKAQERAEKDTAYSEYKASEDASGRKPMSRAAFFDGPYKNATRPMSPEERQQWGIPENDTSPYMMTNEGPKKIGGGSGTTVNVGAGEKAWDTESAKLFAKRYDEMSKMAGNASEMLGMYDLAERALDTGLRTGTFGDMELDARRFAEAIGVPTEDENGNMVAGGELLRSIQNRMALTMRNPDSGMGMPGAVSDRDITFLKQAQVGMENSPEGNRVMLEAFRRIEQRKIELANLADQYVTENGQLDTGFNQVVRQFAEANPLFDDAMLSGRSGAPQEGAVEDGYRFKGGDPADPNSWEPTQ